MIRRSILINLESLSFDRSSSDEENCPKEENRSSTRIFIVETLEKLVERCGENPMVKFESDSPEENLGLQVEALLDFSLVAARSSDDRFRFAGLTLLKKIVAKFFTRENRFDFDERKIFGALRSTFARETDWRSLDAATTILIGFSRQNFHEPNKLWRNFEKIFFFSLEKFVFVRNRSKNGDELSNSAQILSILHLWAQIFHSSFDKEILQVFFVHWLAVLTDFALLNFCSEPKNRKTFQRDGKFFSAQSDVRSIKIVYRNVFPGILRAVCRSFLQNESSTSFFVAQRKLSIHGRHEIIFNKFLGLTLNENQRTNLENKDDIFDLLLGEFCARRIFGLSEINISSFQVLVVKVFFSTNRRTNW